MNIFITGTDTHIGKTHVACQLLKQYKHAGLKTLAIKPVASGCVANNQTLINDDALKLQQAATIKLDYELVNPIRFESPISPNIAAAQTQYPLSAQHIVDKIQPALCIPADIYIVEGVGGWQVPINRTETMADFVKKIQFDVILVVGMRLGCLNHAILTYQQIQHSGVNCLGWIANCIDPTMQALTENIDSLKHWFKVPLLQIIPYQVP